MITCGRVMYQLQQPKVVLEGNTNVRTKCLPIAIQLQTIAFLSNITC